MLSIKRPIVVEDLRDHSAETVDQLKKLLASGAALRPEDGRPNFFEVDGDDQIFYVHVSPHTGKIWLLAAWTPHLAEEKVA